MKKRSNARTLEELVGSDVYGIWIAMLAELVPDGRTHRLGVFVAGLLQYAASVAHRRFGSKPPKGSLAELLLYPHEVYESTSLESPYDGDGHPLDDVVRRLFEDAKVKSVRVNARGGEYGIIPHVVSEYACWFDMPWE